MKNYNVVTVFPEMIEAICGQGVLGQAQKSALLRVSTLNPRVFATDTHKTIDDRPFGGGDGMLMLAEPLAQAIESFQPRGKVVYLSPKGQLFTDRMAQTLAQEETLSFVCGRYGGVDQRFINQFVDLEISLGNFVLSGGELAAASMIDSISRFVPGVLGHEQSAAQDSITCGYLEAASFTRPRDWRGQVAPEILLSGHHQKIEDWKLFVGILTSWQSRPEMAVSAILSIKQIENLSNFAKKIPAAELAVLGLVPFDHQEFRDWLGARFNERVELK